MVLPAHRQQDSLYSKHVLIIELGGNFLRFKIHVHASTYQSYYGYGSYASMLNIFPGASAV